MQRQFLGALALLCALAVAAATGCGGSDSKDFAKEYNKIVREFRTLPSDVGSAVGGASAKSDVALAAQFRGLANRASREVDKLAKLSPPDDAKDEFNAFVGVLRRIAGDLRAISSAAAAHDASKARHSTRSLIEDAKRASGAERALKKAVD
jgi:hypothetical protein